MKLYLQASAVAAIPLLAACTTRRSLAGSDASVSVDGSVDAGPVFSANCPSSAVFDHQTCTGSTNGAVCLGMQFCDSCSMNVATSCTCMPYTSGFEFRCGDPCAGCGIDAGHGGEDGGTSVVGLGGCSDVHNAGQMSCYEYGPEHEGEDVRTSCETEGAGTYVGSCPLEDRIGGCNLGDYGTAWYYVGDSAESQMEFCAMIPDAPWVDP